MPIKLTYEFIKSEFDKEGYTLLSKEYLNNKIKLDYACPQGHKHSITWGCWKQGARCLCCSGNVKYSIDFVKESFEKEGYILLSKEYVRAHSKLNYICSKGHKHSIRWNDWRIGRRCPSCARVAKPSFEFVKASFEKEGCTLLSKDYINSHTKLNYICAKGHEHSIKWYHWKLGHRCIFCAQAKPSIEFVKSDFEKEGYILLSTEYINNRIKLKYVCPNGHKHSVAWANWKIGHRCFSCAKIRSFGEGNSNWQGGASFAPYCPIWKDKEYKKDIKERDGHQCLNPYCDRKNTKLTIHHINYNKKECSPANLITLCASCNTKANYNREWHESWYKAIMYRRYLK